MHILATSSATLDDLIEPVDLAQTPADMVALSFTDSDLAALRAAWEAESNNVPDMRFAPLRELRHPMSVDLWIDSVAAHAKTILVRVLGGYDWWRYGCDQLAAMARRTGARLLFLPGECREDDERLARLSTIDPAERTALFDCFRYGGPENMRIAIRRLAGLDAGDPQPLAKAGFYKPGHGIVSISAFAATTRVVPILFYRSMLLAADVAPIDALTQALEARGITAVPIFVSSLRDGEALDLLAQTVAALKPAALITATAFASMSEPGSETRFDHFGLPVFQVVTATTRRAAWVEGQRGLAPADLAMHVVLPELDGRIMAGAISFKDSKDSGAAALQTNWPEMDRIAQVADRISNFLKLAGTPRAKRRIAILIPDYPAATGRTGYAVGLDVPASVLAMLYDLKDAGYSVDAIPATARDLMRRLEREQARLPLSDYQASFNTLPETAREKLLATWGEPADEAFAFHALQCGNVTVTLAPDRGRAADRRADYHDPALAPCHALVAFGLWLRQSLGCDALIHVGAHGTLEWLPGKTVALSRDCFPEIVTGTLPVIYPFIVSNPGEAAQAKRRISAVTLGHLTPPLVGAGLSEDQRELERLVDEYAQAEGLDRRRREKLARLIVETAARTGLGQEAGVSDSDDDLSALTRIDAWLCDVKDFAIKDGLHIYGRGSEVDDPARAQSAKNEQRALIDALDGKHIAAGPSGAPSRGRTDVLPTGRNLFTSDPRTLPTPTAFALGKQAADEVVRAYCQEHGDWPRALVMDLWGSASLRTGGEEIAQGLAMMGCKPQWDHATGRVTGIEVLPPAAIGRPRIDVTWRISGLFRDMFPTQIALLDTAVAAVAARDEPDEDNPLAEAARRDQRRPARIFGSAPGTFGSGIEEKLASGDWNDRATLGALYLDNASHAYGGAEGDSTEAAQAFAARVADADLLIHTGDDAGRDLLEGSADVAFIGGFAAALAALGKSADLVVLDTTNPGKPRARSLVEAVTRTVRARAINPRFIAGQMRHGPRGASEFAETVDRLVGFAETTEAIPPTLIEAVHDAYLGDPAVRAFLLDQNPAAARAIAQRFMDARRRGLWHPLRNSIDSDLADLIAEARALEGAA
jgi:cobaltochelatase CobN